MLEPGDQGIRGGYGIAPLSYYAVFISNTLCGASLIHGDILLTAAHCVDDNGFPDQVRVGSNDYFAGGVESKVKAGVLYPEWTWQKASDPDLAVLLLEDFLPNQVAELNTDPNVPTTEHYNLFAMGFGLVDSERSSRELLGAQIPYLEDCSARSDTYNRTRHICASSSQVATCGGDSGSPIMFGPYSNVQVGINSYSNGDCMSQTLDIYTRISFYHEWIEEQVCKLSANPPARCLETPSPTPPATDAPSASATTIAPTVSPTIATTTASPTSVATTAIPTEPAAVATDSPTIAATTAIPTEPAAATTDVPTIPATTASPTDPPATAAPTSSPTLQVTTTAPTVVATTDSPTNKITDQPTNAEPATKASTLAPTLHPTQDVFNGATNIGWGSGSSGLPIRATAAPTPTWMYKNNGGY